GRKINMRELTNNQIVEQALEISELCVLIAALDLNKKSNDCDFRELLKPAVTISVGLDSL
ncbi:hypothetical protein ACT922_000796, partial [Campylobacter upsaliensis]|uniref:hypothetical protein n=1 Tax=Campylobacter upsaliensis TaxID=28080 RepID=UPI0012C4A0E1